MRRVTRTALAIALACLAAAAPAAAQSSDPPPTVDVVGGVGEEGGPIPFMVTLSRASSQPVTVDYITGDGTAQRGRDYHGRRGTLTIPAGEVSVPLAFNAILDPWLETDEQFRVELSNPTGARFGDNLDRATIRNVLLAGRCTNLLDGRNRVDILTGSDAGDRINGRSDQDVIFGLAGDDCLYGHAGADQIRGGAGDDKLNGGTGNDRLNGGAATTT
jgi:Ca2+-binding RTX toxin-like protein